MTALLVAWLALGFSPSGVEVQAPQVAPVVGKLDVVLVGYSSLNGKYVRYDGVAVALGYAAAPAWHLDVTVGLPGLSRVSYTRLARRLYEHEGLLPAALSLKSLRSFGTVGAAWRALYGKAVIGERLVGLDLRWRAAAGIVETRASCPSGTDGCEGTSALGVGRTTPSDAASRWRPAASVGAAVQATLLPWRLSVEIADLLYLDVLHGDAGAQRGWRQLVTARLGVAWLWGGG